MRRIKTYLHFFRLPLFFVATAIVSWFYVPDTFSVFKGSLFGTLLGVGISIAVAESFKRLIEYKRVKKTFGLLKLITIPYLKNQAENLQATIKQYDDICSIEKATILFVHCSHLDSVVAGFDKSWLQLIYSQNFLDATNNDEHFNKMANAIFEVLLFLKQLSFQSVNAKINQKNDIYSLSDDQKKDFIERAQKIRDELKDNADKLLKYTTRLEEEIDRFFNMLGVKYSEFER